MSINEQFHPVTVTALQEMKTVPGPTFSEFCKPTFSPACTVICFDKNCPKNQLFEAPGMHKNIGNPYQMEDNKAAPSAPPQGGGASRRPLGFLLLAHILYDFSYMFGCFSVFPMIFAEKIVFPGPFCPGPISRLPKKTLPEPKSLKI